MVALLLAGLLAGGTSAEVPNHAVILLYHHVDTGTPASTTVTPHQFRNHLDWMEGLGYTVLPLVDVVDSLRSGGRLPDRTVVLTFDDGYRSVYIGAFPELKARGLPFTVFVCPDDIDRGRGPVMTWDQLREMAAAGATIANHGHEHAHLHRRRAGEDGGAWRTRLRRELRAAQERIREEIGTALPFFAYPYGEHDRDLRALIIEQGWTGFGQQSGPAGEGSDMAALPRFPLMGEHAALESLGEKMRSLPLPVVAVEPRDPQVALAATGDSLALRPALRLQLEPADADWSRVNAFVSNQGAADLAWEAGPPRRLVVRAREDLGSGRQRYNVTAPSPWPDRWYWYSHQWIVGDEHED